MLSLIVTARLLAATPAAVPPSAATADDVDQPRTIVERGATNTCPHNVTHCFGLDVHVVTVDGDPVASIAWLDQQIASANHHFAAIDVGFEIAHVGTAPSTYVHVATREQRDAIGLVAEHRGHRDLVPLFLVSRLDDVDAPGEQIRGVHWRRRQNVEQRWVILSTIAQPMVLAHELGHFFGLSHSTYAVSIMNKRPRARPPHHQRTFAPPELVTLRRGRDDAVRSGVLLNRAERGRP